MKKLILLLLFPLMALGLSSCEELKRPGGNQMIEGSRQFNYAYVCSQVTGNKYYHISGWKEYEPEGTNYSSYTGLELQLATSKDVIYYWEPNLMYILTKNYNSNYGKAIE